MNPFGMITVPATTHVDTSPTTGEVLLTHIDEDLESTVVRFTPATAYKLGLRLIDAAQRLESPT
jgi:hypothetical protein